MTDVYDAITCLTAFDAPGTVTDFVRETAYFIAKNDGYRKAPWDYWGAAKWWLSFLIESLDLETDGGPTYRFKRDIPFVGKGRISIGISGVPVWDLEGGL